MPVLTRIFTSPSDLAVTECLPPFWIAVASAAAIDCGVALGAAVVDRGRGAVDRRRHRAGVVDILRPTLVPPVSVPPEAVAVKDDPEYHWVSVVAE